MYYLPTRVVFGEGALRDNAALLDGIGKKALLVTGARSAAASGALDDCVQALRMHGIGHTQYSWISENPELDSIIAGKDVMLAEGCDLVIGIGGGSPLDAAKAISIAAANKLPRDQLYQSALFAKAFPIIAIPTTSGTGSEVTQYAVLSDRLSGRKAGWGHPLAFPRLAFCDPAYTFSLNPEVTTNTGIDALSHLLEGIYSSQREPVIYPLIHTGIGDIMQYLPVVIQEPSNPIARARMMRASLYGGITIAQAGTTLQHSIGYPLTSRFGLPHGLANAVVMRAIMELYYPAVREPLDAAMANCGHGKDSFLAWLEGIVPQPELPLDDAFIAASVPEVMASRNMANNPIRVTADQIADIYKSIRRI